jgi:hypothetical protein
VANIGGKCNKSLEISTVASSSHSSSPVLKNIQITAGLGGNLGLGGYGGCGGAHPNEMQLIHALLSNGTSPNSY